MLFVEQEAGIRRAAFTLPGEGEQKQKNPKTAPILVQISDDFWVDSNKINNLHDYHLMNRRRKLLLKY